MSGLLSVNQSLFNEQMCLPAGDTSDNSVFDNKAAFMKRRTFIKHTSLTVEPDTGIGRTVINRYFQFKYKVAILFLSNKK